MQQSSSAFTMYLRAWALAFFAAVILVGGRTDALKLFGHQLPNPLHRGGDESCDRSNAPCDVTGQQASQGGALSERGTGGALMPSLGGEWLAPFDWAFAPISPLRTLAPLARQMDELMASRAFAPAASVARTAVDVRETPEAFEFVADVPGLAKEDIKVVVSEDNVLTISGERRLVVDEGAAEPTKEGVAETGKDVTAAAGKPPVHHRIERSFGRFVRSFQLPRNADADKVSAQVVSGVLTVRAPKKEVAPEVQARGRVPIAWKDL